MIARGITTVIIAAIFAVSPAMAGGAASHSLSQGRITLDAGAGYAALRGDEIVYDEDGSRLSHLIWQSDSPVVTGRVGVDIGGAWTLSGGAIAGLAADSHMDDYDWTEFSPSQAFDDWSDHSMHPDTKLHRYINLDVAIGRDFTLNDRARLNLHGGLKYANVKWTAYGGSYVYSELGFRDDAGDFPDGEIGISFEQRYPAWFAGMETMIEFGALTFSGRMRGGMTFNASDTDHHWGSDTRFEEEYGAAAFVSPRVRIDRTLNRRAALFFTGSYDRYFNKIGDATLYSIETGEFLESAEDGAGMKFSSLAVTVGLRVGF